MKLVIVHSHYRPGGVRRVIELATPSVAAALRPPVTGVVLLGGEAPDAGWLAAFRAAMSPRAVTCAAHPTLGYVSEQTTPVVGLARRVRSHLRRWLADVAREGGVVWAHNPGLGRNLVVAAELKRVCAELSLPLVFHHHDWWFDNRWARWPEMRRTGFRTLEQVAKTVLPARAVRHATINQADARVLRQYFGAQAGWVPNLATAGVKPAAEETRRARQWLREQLGDDGPVWLVPCRLLRRKNLAEALLIARWLRPEAWLVTTGATSSAEENAYASALERAARRHGWRLRLQVLARGEAAKPRVPALLAASEVILLTSLQEGFGLPSLEAAAAHRPLIARSLPNIAPDLARFGFRFPQSYDDILIDVRLFDVAAEMARQIQRWETWRGHLPRACRSLAGKPPLLAGKTVPRAVAFSRLTLTAQLEVLAQPVEQSWEWCRPLNPFLATWRRRAAVGKLAATRWPSSAEKWLGGVAYARHFLRLLEADTGGNPKRQTSKRQSGLGVSLPRGVPVASTVRGAEKIEQASVAASDDFIRAKLAGENQYPLLWTIEP